MYGTRHDVSRSDVASQASRDVVAAAEIACLLESYVDCASVLGVLDRLSIDILAMPLEGH